MNEYLNIISKIQLYLGTNIPDNILLSFIFIVIFLIFIKRVKSNFYFIYVITLPGTFMHELSHYIFSLFLNGKPVSFTIIARKKDLFDKNNNKIGYSATMGSVSSENIRWYNGFFISLSPLILFVLAFYFILYLENVNNDYFYFFYLYLITNLIYGGLPSSTDWLVCFNSSKWFLLFIFSIVFICSFLKIYLF